MPVSGWQESECPLHSQSSQWPRYKPPPVRVYPGAQSLKRQYDLENDEPISVFIAEEAQSAASSEVNHSENLVNLVQPKIPNV